MTTSVDTTRSADPAHVDVETLIREMLADYTKLPIEQITSDRSLDDIGLDSLGALELILSCEDVLHISALDDGDMEVHTVGDAVAFVRAKL